MGSFRDNPNKTTIRDYWCKPIIKHIHEKFGYDLVYLGLPGLDAIDLLTWIEYLHYVIAIDCGHYPEKGKKFDMEIAKANIKKLNTILNGLERRGEILGYSLYLGYLEEIVLKGIDKNGQKFDQKSIVNIYNLDFCNTLTHPVTITDLKGNVSTYYKNQVIRRLLEFERNIEKEDSLKRFLMFITVHSNFCADEAKNHFKCKNDSSFDTYKNYIRGLNKTERDARLLRFYFLDVLNQHFTGSSISPYFFPTILYEGAGQNKLMCFTIAGKYQNSPSAIAPFNQDIDELIHQKFLLPNNQGIDFLISSIKEINPQKNPINQLEESLFFQK